MDFESVHCRVPSATSQQVSKVERTLSAARVDMEVDYNRKLELGVLPSGTVRIAREWPIGRDLKLDLPYVRCAREVGLLHAAVVRRCCLDGWKKVWEVMCNDPGLASALGTGKCNCVAPKVPNVTASSEYSLEVARHVVSRVPTMFQVKEERG